MKLSVEYHEQCLVNMQSSAARAEDRAKAVANEALRLRNNCNRLAAQIERAKKERKDAFDPDKYLPTR